MAVAVGRERDQLVPGAHERHRRSRRRGDHGPRPRVVTDPMGEHGHHVDHEAGGEDRATFEDMVQELGDGGAHRVDVATEQLGEPA